MSRARRAGEVGGRAGVSPAPLAAAGAPAAVPAANAGGSGDSRLTTPGGVSGGGGPLSAVGEHRGQQSEVEEAREKPTAFGGLQFSAACVDATQLANS